MCGVFNKGKAVALVSITTIFVQVSADHSAHEWTIDPRVVRK